MREQNSQEKDETKDRNKQEEKMEAEADIVLSLIQWEELGRVPACEGDWG